MTSHILSELKVDFMETTLVYLMSVTNSATCLEFRAARYIVVEEWFMKEQGAFPQIVLVVEVFAARQVETLQRAPALDNVLHGVRCVRAAFTTAKA